MISTISSSLAGGLVAHHILCSYLNQTKGIALAHWKDRVHAGCSQNYADDGDIEYYGSPTMAATIFNLFCGILFVIGVLGNGFVVAIIACFLRLETITNVFVLNLAIADFLYLSWLPLVVLRNVYGEWVWGQAGCKLYTFCTGINRWGSAIFLISLCVDRYLAVCHPIKSRPYRTVRAAFVSVAICWILVIALMSPLIVTATVQPEFEATMPNGTIYYRYQCGIYWIVDRYNPSLNQTVPQPDIFGRRVFTLYTVGSSIFFIIVTWTLYTNIISSLVRRQSRSMATVQSRKRTTRKVTRMVFAVLLCYTFCWIPVITVNILIEFCNSAFTNLSPNAYYFIMFASYLLNYLNSACNPILYTLLNDTYRHVIIDRCLKSSPPRHGCGRLGTQGQLKSSPLQGYLRREPGDYKRNQNGANAQSNTNPEEIPLTNLT